MAALPSVALQFLPEDPGNVLGVGLLGETEVLQDGGLLPLGLLRPQPLHQIPQELVAVLLLHPAELVAHLHWLNTRPGEMTEDLLEVEAISLRKVATFSSSLARAALLQTAASSPWPDPA